MTRQCMSLCIKIMYYSGFWVKDYEPISYLYYWRHFFPRLMIFRLSYGLVLFQGMSLHVTWGNLTSMTESIINIQSHFISLVKVCTLYYYRVRLKHMINQLENLNDPEGVADDVLRDALNKANRFCDAIVRYGMILCLGLLIFVSMTLFAGALKKRAIPFRRWFPYDVSQSPMFELTLVFTLTMQISDLILVPFSDILFASLMVQLLTQFKILRYRLEKLREIAVHTSLGKPKPIARCQSFTSKYVPSVQLENDSHKNGTIHSHSRCRTISSSNSCVDNADKVIFCLTEQGTCLPGQVDMCFIDAMPTPDQGQSIRKSERDSRHRILDDKMEANLTQCVVRHQMLIGLCHELQSVFKVMLAWQVLCTALMSLFALYISTLAETVDFMVITVGLAVWSVVTALFFFCMIGNELTDESALIFDAAYACDWLDASESFKRSIRIIMARAQKPLVIRAAGLPLSRRTFKMIVKSAYYIHAMLDKIYHGEKIN